MKFAVVGNTYQDRKMLFVEQLVAYLCEQHDEVCIDREFYAYLIDKLHLNLPQVSLFEGHAIEADMVLSIGGDGTFLKATNRVGNKEIPILGINTGRLGFLADVLPNEAIAVIEEIKLGKCHIENRTVLQATCTNSKFHETLYALNEIALLKRDTSSMIAIHTSINGEYLTTYQADGLIVATPTGSTAYSLSNGGPIIVPLSNTIALTPVAPHSLNMRPVVLNDDVELMLAVKSRSHNFLLAVDGRNLTLPDDSNISIRKADYTVKVVKRHDEVYYATLRNKMMWGADGRD